MYSPFASSANALLTWSKRMFYSLRACLNRYSSGIATDSLRVFYEYPTHFYG